MYTDIIVLDDKTVKLQFDDQGDLVTREVNQNNYEDSNLNGDISGPLK